MLILIDEHDNIDIIDYVIFLKKVSLFVVINSLYNENWWNFIVHYSYRCSLYDTDVYYIILYVN